MESYDRLTPENILHIKEKANEKINEGRNILLAFIFPELRACLFLKSSFYSVAFPLAQIVTSRK